MQFVEAADHQLALCATREEDRRCGVERDKLSEQRKPRLSRHFSAGQEVRDDDRVSARGGRNARR